MEGDDHALDELKREVQQLKQQLAAIKVMLEENGYKVDSRREH